MRTNVKVSGVVGSHPPEKKNLSLPFLGCTSIVALSIDSEFFQQELLLLLALALAIGIATDDDLTIDLCSNDLKIIPSVTPWSSLKSHQSRQ